MMTRSTGQSKTVHFEKERGVTAVQVTRGIAHATIELPAENLPAERLALLQSLAAEGIPVFLVKLHPTGLSFALRQEQVENGVRLLEQRGVSHVVLRDLGLVSVIAGAMRDLSGVMSSIYEALVEAGVAVRQTGDAYNAVLCLVSGSDVAKSSHALHARFSLDAASEAQSA